MTGTAQSLSEFLSNCIVVDAHKDPLDRRLAKHWQFKIRGGSGVIRIFALPNGRFSVDNTVTNEMNEARLTDLPEGEALERVLSWIGREKRIQEAIRTRLTPIAELDKS